jgi:hypothetical protein
MKKRLFVWIGTVVFLFLVACSNHDKVADGLIHYYNNDWQQYQTMKQEKVTTRKHDLYRIDHPKEGLDFLENKVLPEYKAIIDSLKEIEFGHKEVQELNQLQIDAEEFGYQLMEEDGHAYYRNEITDEEIWEHVDQLEDLYDIFAKQRDKLMKKYDLIFEEATNENGKPIQVMKRKTEAN